MSYSSGRRTPNLPKKPVLKALSTKENLSRRAAATREKRHTERYDQKVATWTASCRVVTQVPFTFCHTADNCFMSMYYILIDTSATPRMEALQKSTTRSWSPMAPASGSPQGSPSISDAISEDRQHEDTWLASFHGYISIYTCFCPFICLSIYVSVYPSISIYLSMYISMYVSIDVSMYICQHLCRYLFIYVSMYPCIYIHVYMYLSMYLPVYLCIYLSTYIYLSIL